MGKDENPVGNSMRQVTNHLVVSWLFRRLFWAHTETELSVPEALTGVSGPYDLLK